MHAFTSYCYTGTIRESTEIDGFASRSRINHQIVSFPGRTSRSKHPSVVCVYARSMNICAYAYRPVCIVVHTRINREAMKIRRNTIKIYKNNENRKKLYENQKKIDENLSMGNRGRSIKSKLKLIGNQ